jgi:hypothetical protein
MKIEEFVSKTILDIINGVQKAIDEQGAGVRVNPIHCGEEPSTTRIAFDLTVYPDRDEVKVSGDSPNNNPNLKFDVDVILPGTKPNK